MQSSLAAAKKSLGGKPEGCTSPHHNEFEDAVYVGTQTPVSNTQTKHASNGLDVISGREANGGFNSIGPLLKEFEQRRQNFENEAKSIIEVKTGQHPDLDLRKLRQRFEEWKKDYKSRLREAKAKLQKLGYTEGDKSVLKWLGKWNKRS